jgi:cytochrome c553
MNAYQRMYSAAVGALLLLSSAAALAAGDAAAGAEKAKGCASCHGLDGKGRIPLAGKRADYLEEQLRAFKSGVRKERMMNMMAGNLSDQDIADLAAYFASK